MDDQKLATDRTIPLVKSKRYESFQFHAISEPASKTITAEELFKKEILYVLGWIRSRCRDTDLPKEINELPKPEDYKSYKMNEIKPFRYDIGYKLEVVFIEDEEKKEKTWAIQIVEPDRGPFPEDPEKNRYVVPGRLFVTDIGLKLFDNKVEIGTRTYVDEPEGTTHECDAFRQVFIKQLIKDNDIKLKAATEEMREWPITEKPFLIKNNVNLESLIEWIKYPKRQALAVIYAENKDKIANKENEEGLEIKIEDLENKRATFDELARDLRGYAFFFNIPYERRIEFLKKMEIPSEKSDLFIIEADKYDLKEPYNFSMYDFLNETAVQEEVYRKIKKYFEHKHANFGKVQFVPDVRENSFSEFMNVKRSKQEIIAEHDIILHDKRQEYESLLTKRDEQIEMLKNKLKVKEIECEKVKERLSDFENKKTELETRHSLEETKIKHKLERERFKGNRPKDFKDLNKWVSKYLCDSLILSKRAQDEISKIDKEYSIDNICDSIEHLAMDYYEQLMGLITEEERNHRCSEIYNSYINITYLSLPKITNKKDYEFTYIKKNGSSTTAYIDQHVYLKGSEGRIYFTFDKDDQRLIIASLPKHLTY